MPKQAPKAAAEPRKKRRWPWVLGLLAAFWLIAIVAVKTGPADKGAKDSDYSYLVTNKSEQPIRFDLEVDFQSFCSEELGTGALSHLTTCKSNGGCDGTERAYHLTAEYQDGTSRGSRPFSSKECSFQFWVTNFEVKVYAEDSHGNSVQVA